MKLNNSALQELYDTLVNGTISFSPYTESPVAKAFRECDEKLSESVTFEQIKNLQDRNDILEKANGNLLNANLDLCTEKGHLKKRITQLEKENKLLTDSRDEWSKRAIANRKQIIELQKELKETKERANASETNMNEFAKQVNVLKTDLDNLKKANGVLASTNAELTATVTTMKENDKKHSEKVAIMRRSLERVVEERDDLKKKNCQLERDRDFYFNKYQELKKDYERVTEEKRKSNARTDCLRAEVNWYRKHYKEQYDKIRELNHRLNSMYGDEYIKKLQDSVRNIGYENGQINLWNMLQNVRDVKPEEFDPECETLGDILDMDLENFLDAYKKWQKQKETDRMRNWLADFCDGRWCKECPLESDEFKCGNGYTFRGTNPIPDKDIKGYYEKARGCGGYTLKNVTYYFDNKPVTMTEEVKNVNRTISKACENFCKAVRDADIKITENLRKGCTFEATVEVNKDLLEKVCGVKPDDK